MHTHTARKVQAHTPHPRSALAPSGTMLSKYNHRFIAPPCRRLREDALHHDILGIGRSLVGKRHVRAPQRLKQKDTTPTVSHPSCTTPPMPTHFMPSTSPFRRTGTSPIATSLVHTSYPSHAQHLHAHNTRQPCFMPPQVQHPHPVRKVLR